MPAQINMDQVKAAVEAMSTEEVAEWIRSNQRALTLVEETKERWLEEYEDRCRSFEGICLPDAVAVEPPELQQAIDQRLDLIALGQEILGHKLAAEALKSPRTVAEGSSDEAA